MIDAIRRFFISADFYKSLTFIISSLIPILVFYYLFDQVEIGFAIALGVFYNSSTNSPGSVKHRTVGMVVSIVFTTLATLIIGYSASNIWVLLPVLGVSTFFVSYISIYGFRASLVSLSALLAIVISFAHSYINLSILDYTALVFVGGVWYLLVASLANYLNPKMYIEELLSDTMKLTGEFLETRSKLLVERNKREKLNEKLFNLQAELTNKHETLRDVLLTNRQKSGFSNRIRRKLLLFIELVDIFELAIANPVNYEKVDTISKDNSNCIFQFVDLINEMASHFNYMSKVIIRDKKVTVNFNIEKKLGLIQTSIDDYNDTIGVSEDREGFYMLVNLFEYQAVQVKKIHALERVLNVFTKNNSLKKEESVNRRFLTPQDYDVNKLIVNFSLKSSILRHSLRLSITMMFGFLLGNLFSVQNPYWILLTIVVIMRPSYGLTKQRMKHRIIGTFLGSAIALSIVYIIQWSFALDYIETIYAVLSTVSLILASALVQLNYRTFATFLTMHIVFMYALFQGDVIDVIQFRVVDTILGGGLAILANLFLFPSWEFMTVRESIMKTLTANSKYLEKIEECYHSRDINLENYKLSRKTAFLAMGNVNSSFQRMTQEPKSRRKYFSEIYDIVVIINTFLSSLASLGTFIRKHKLSKDSEGFSVFVENIIDNLANARHLLLEEELEELHEESEIEEAKSSFEKRYKELNFEYDKIFRNSDLYETEISDVSLEIRQNQMILDQLSYLFSLSESLIQKISIYQDNVKKDSYV